MAKDDVRVSFFARTEVQVMGEMMVPAVIWNTVADDDNWSPEVERYIAAHVQIDHFDVASAELDDGDFDNIEIVPDELAD